MSDTDPTPETPVTIGDRMGWWRANANANFLVLVDKIDLVATKLDSLITAIQALAGPAPGKSLADIYGTLHYQDSNSVNWTTAGALNAIHLALLNTDSDDVAEILTNIAAGIGAQPYNSLELATQRAFLWGILQAVQQIGILPDGSLGDYEQSEGTQSTGGRRYILWGSINGVNRDVTHIQLTPIDSWAGFEVYIQTSSPSAMLHDSTVPANSTEIPVNSWVGLMGTDTLSFSVETSFQATGYMRGMPSGSGYTLTTTAFSSYWWLVQTWPAAIPNSGSVATGDFYGWQIQHVSGKAVRVKHPTGDTPIVSVTTGQTATINVHTPNGIQIGSRLNDEGLGEAVVRLIPPA